MPDELEHQFLQLIEAARAAGALDQAHHYTVSLERYRAERAEKQAQVDAPTDNAD